MAYDGARALPCGRMQCLVLVRQDVGVPVAHLTPELQKNRGQVRYRDTDILEIGRAHV